MEQRLEKLAQTVEELMVRVERLEEALSASPPRRERSGAPDVGATPEPTAAPAWEWGRASRFLSRAAGVCFLLAVALVLRALVDGAVLPPGIGVALGLAYAGGLLAVGWATQLRGSPWAPVLTVTGLLLSCTVVLESRLRYGVTPPDLGYALLGIAGLGTAAAGRWGRAAWPTWVGMPAVLASAVLLEFPAPSFPGLTLAVLAANVMAYGVAPIAPSGWLRLVGMVVAVGVWAVWGIDAFERGGAGAGFAEAATFAALLGAYAAFFAGTSFVEAFRRDRPALGAVDAAGPAVTALWVHGAAVLAYRGDPAGFLRWTAVEVAAGGAGLALAWVLARRHGAGAKGANPFVLAACLWWGMALPELLPRGAFALPLIGGLGLAVWALSRRWHSGGVRVTSYLVQALACLTAAVSGGFSVGDGAPWARGAAACGFAVVALTHYRQARRTAPPADSGFFTQWDRTDDSAVAVLLAALVGAFLGLRLWGHELLAAVGAGGADGFAAFQSLLINGSALGLLAAAASRRNAELRGVGVAVLAVGALKVFLYDLLAVSGLALVWSVLSLGGAAGAGAVVLRRWGREARPG
ncbi:MAG: hypothetical protein Kow0092_13700 [Deferrisomatales bacterium]